MKNERELIARNHDFWKNTGHTELASPEFYARSEAILRAIGKVLLKKHFRVADIGCGNGRFTQIISNYCASITGYDLSSTLLALAQATHPLANGGYVATDLEKDDFKLGDLDIVFCLGIFSTLHDEAAIGRILAKVAEALPIGGILVSRDTISADETYKKAYDNGYYAVYRSFEEHMRLFAKAGFVLRKTIPVSNVGTLRNSFFILARTS